MSFRIAAVAFLLFCSSATADLVNLDFVPSSPTGTAHVGNDGVLSKAGTFWNAIPAPDMPILALQDDTGSGTGLSYFGDVFGQGDPNASNTLQDHGMQGQFDVSGFVPGSAWNVAVYFAQTPTALPTDPPILGGAILQHLGGPETRFQSAVATYGIPGLEGHDYVLFSNVMPTNAQSFTIESTGNGSIAGVQFSPVPEPTSLGLLLVASSVILSRRSRRERSHFDHS